MESVKLIEKAYRKKMKKQRWQKTLPSFKNFDIDIDEAQYFEQIRIIVTNLLDSDEKPRFSRIHSLQETGATFVFSSIICPICRKPINLNYHWNSFICNCKEHDKKIYEISKVVIEDGIPKETIGQEVV